jgi:hypothetical protein
MRHLLAIFIFLFLGSFQLVFSQNPAAPDFDAAGSDAKAIEIADAVMAAQGGRQAWDETRYLQWTFFGRRSLLWDKWTGDVRIDWLDRPRNIIVNINNGTGQVRLNGIEQTQPDTLKKYLDLGRRVWINDAYWLVMPFKLKDSGVTLRYLGEKPTDDGRVADLLQLTFKGVGVTPDNKYHVWVDGESRLVTQWAFFKLYTDEKAEFSNPWTDYARVGRLILSGGRGKGSALTDIAAPETVPARVFEAF